MTFGLLSFGQMALVAGLAGAAVVAIFLLKVRHPLVVVPSLVLWRRVLDERRQDSLLERLRRLISLFIALAIAWLLAVALGEPRPDGVRGGRLALVIDNGPTMNAVTPGGETRLERARDAARVLVAQAGSEARFQVADTTGAVRTPADLDRQSAVDAIGRIRPGFGAPRVPSAAGGYETVIFTDGARLDPPASARLVSLAGPVPNVGIAAFEIRATPARPFEHTAYLSIVNFDTTTRDVRISIGAPGRLRVQRSVPLAGGAALRQVLPMDELDQGIVEARIASDGDRFPMDDVAFGWLPDRRTWRVTLVSPGQAALAAVLAADPRVTLQVIAPDEYRPSLDADIVVFDRFTPASAPRQPALLFGPAPSGWLPLAPQSRTLPALVATNADHPLMAAVSLDDLHVTRTAVLADPEASALAADAEHLVVGAGRAAAPWVAVGFALDDSNFASQPSFPIFVANVLAWFRGDTEPLTTRPGLVEVPWPGASVADADGRSVPARSALGSTRFMAEGPGVFFATSGGVRVPVVVNLADTGWAATTAGPEGTAAGLVDDLPMASSRPWWTVLAIAALLLLTVEWWTWQRRITV